MADVAGNDSPGHGSTMPPDAIGSWWPSPPPVSRKLLNKASVENKSLTSTERLYLLSLLDLPGKALARPESVTAEERDFLLGRPSPAILESILRRFFPVPSAEPPADADAGHGHRVSGVDGQQKTDQQVQKTPSHCRSIPEVVAAYGQPTQMAKLSLAAQECVTLGWWTLQYEQAPRPWEDFSDADNAGTAAAELMSRDVRPEERAFEDAVRALWCRPENAGKLGIDHSEELDDTDGGDGNPDEAEQVERWAAEASRLREELRAQVAAQLAELSREGREALLQLREHVQAEAAQDAEEDARKKEAEEEECRKRRAELAEEKRAKQAQQAHKGLAKEDEDSSEDSDMEG